VDDRLAAVEVDRSAGDGERVDPFRAQGGVDRCQPAPLTVADQVHPAARVIDRAFDRIEVIVDAGILGACARPDPVKRVRTLESGREDRAHLALPGGEVDDARVVSGLWW